MPDALYTPVHLRGLPTLANDEAVEWLHGVADGEVLGDRKIDPARLAAAILGAGPAFTSVLANAVARALVNKLDDFPNVLDFGSSVGVGNATNDTTAFQRAAASGASFHVLNRPGLVYRLQDTVTLSAADGQRIDGGGARIICTGSGDVFRLRNGGAAQREGQAITNLRLDCHDKTGGTAVDVRSVGRCTLDELRIYSPWNGIYIEGVNDGRIGPTRIYTLAVRGDFGTRIYGSGINNNVGAIRSDVIRVGTLIQSMTSGAGAVAFDWDGNVHTVEVDAIHNVSFDRGIWIRNTSGGTIPIFGHFTRAANDFPQNEGVRIDAGWDFDFLNLHVNNSYLADNVHVSSGVPADMVRIGHHQLTNSLTGYGLRTTGGRVQVNGRGFYVGNALGNFSGPVVASVPGAEWGMNPTTGGASGFGASMNGDVRNLTWGPGSFRGYNPATHTEALTLDGDVIYQANANVWASSVPVSVPRLDLGVNTYLRRNSGTGAVELVVNGVLAESWGP